MISTLSLLKMPWHTFNDFRCFYKNWSWCGHWCLLNEELWHNWRCWKLVETMKNMRNVRELIFYTNSINGNPFTDSIDWCWRACIGNYQFDVSWLWCRYKRFGNYCCWRKNWFEFQIKWTSNRSSEDHNIRAAIGAGSGSEITWASPQSGSTNGATTEN